MSASLMTTELAVLIGLVNNSLVGVSKLLHFIAPHRYPIWDSRVAAYLYPNLPYARMNLPSTYETYAAACAEVVGDPAFAPAHESINRKIGQPVSALRAAELVMYTGGRAV